MTVKSEDVEILDEETDDRIDILNHKQELVLVLLGIYASLNLIDPNVFVRNLRFPMQL